MASEIEAQVQSLIETVANQESAIVEQSNDIADLKDAFGLGVQRFPFEVSKCVDLVAPDDPDEEDGGEDVPGEDEGDDEPKEQQWSINLPAGSLSVDGETVGIVGAESGSLNVGVGEWWCVIVSKDAAQPGGDDQEDAAETEGDGQDEDQPDDPSDGQPGEEPSEDDGDAGSDAYEARIVVRDDEAMSDALFSFPVCTISEKAVEEGEERVYAVKQLAHGAVCVASSSFKTNRTVAFEIDRYIDEDGTARYRAYTPKYASLSVDGTCKSVEEARNEWTELDFVGPQDGVYNVWCWMSDGAAHVGSARQIRKYANKGKLGVSFPVASIGIGSALDGDKWKNGDAFTGDISAVCVGLDHSAIENQLPGATASSQGWASLLRQHTPDVTVLENESATKSAVLDAMTRATQTDGIAVITFMTHGGKTVDNFLVCYDALLTDAEIWNVISRAKGAVWLVFDTCHSETMYGPGSVGPASFGSSLEAKARSSGSTVDMLCWSSCLDDEVGWCNSQTGGYFTSVCLSFANSSVTYDTAWASISSSQVLADWNMHPSRTQFGSFFSGKKMLNIEVDAESSGDDSDDNPLLAASARDAEPPESGHSDRYEIKQYTYGIQVLRSYENDNRRWDLDSLLDSESDPAVPFKSWYSTAYDPGTKETVYLGNVYVPKGNTLFVNGNPIMVYDENMAEPGLNGCINVGPGENSLYIYRADVIGGYKAVISVNPNGALMNDLVHSFPVCVIPDGTKEHSEHKQFMSGALAITIPEQAAKPFDIEFKSEHKIVVNPVFRTAGRTVFAGDLDEYEIDDLRDGILAVRIYVSEDGSVSPQYETFQTRQDLLNAEESTSEYVIPLYEFKDGVVSLDFRSVADIPFYR